MKALFITLLSFLICLSSAWSMGENKQKAAPLSNSNETYIETTMTSFSKMIQDYNKSRTGQNNLVSTLKNKKDRLAFKKFIVENRIEKLPKMNQVNDKAYIVYKNNVIVFSILSLGKGEIIVNGNVVRFDGSSISEKLQQYQKQLNTEKKFSFLSFLIREAYAEKGPSAKLDMILVATVMKSTKGFEDAGLCVMCEDENQEQMKKNFDKLMAEMDKKADACENSGYMKFSDESEVGRLAYEVSEIQEYSKKPTDDDKVKKALEEKFKMLDDEAYKENFTCGQMAYLAHKKEAHEKFRHLSNRSKNALAGYLGSTSAGVEEDGKEFSKYMSQKCAPHARLMNCLATNSDYGKSVYNRESGRDEYKRITVGKDIPEEYKHHTINK